jgi:orotate phosphoribosyltransferase-like protein
MGRFSEALSDLIRLKNSFCHKARRKKTAETFTTLLRLFASVGGKSRKIDDNVIGCVRTRIEVVREVEVNRFHTLRFSVL